MRARDDDTGTGMTDRQLRDEATTLVIAGSETTLEHRRLGLLPASSAPADPGTAAAGSRPGAGRRRCWIRGPEQAALHPRGDYRGAAPVQPGLDTAPPGARGRRARRSAAQERKQDLLQPVRAHRDCTATPDRFEPDRWGAGYSRTDKRATFFPFGQRVRNCIGEGFAWAESTLLLTAIAARWQLRLADGAAVHPEVSRTLVPSELPVIVTWRGARVRKSSPRPFTFP
jgi:hypothetical protein